MPREAQDRRPCRESADRAFSSRTGSRAWPIVRIPLRSSPTLRVEKTYGLGRNPKIPLRIAPLAYALNPQKGYVTGTFVLLRVLSECCLTGQDPGSRVPRGRTAGQALRKLPTDGWSWRAWRQT